MPNVKAPIYLPIATARNKLIIKAMQIGIKVVIDVENSDPPHDRTLAYAWIEIDSGALGSEVFWFENGPSKRPVRFGSAMTVREFMEHSDLVY